MTTIDPFPARRGISHGHKATLCAVVLFTLLSGCGKGPPKDEFLSPEQTPAPITAAANKIFPGIVFEQVWKYEENGETRYEIRGKTPDKQWREVTVSAEGKVLWPVQPE